jgi:ubiquinone/menaquinone biosynthesis C-methylase UbiE
MANKNDSLWDRHIRGLSDFPELTSMWEMEMTREIKSKLPKEIKSVLEVGCSNGRWIRWFCKEYGCEGLGIDNCPEGFKRKDLNFVLSDAFSLPFSDGSVDVVFSTGLIEHFKNPQDFELLKEQARVLKDNGRLICEMPNLAVSLEYFYVKFLYDLKRGYKHYIKTHWRIIRCLQKLNLQIVSSRFLGWFWLLEKLRIPKLFTCSFTSRDYMIIGRKG